MSAKCQKQTDLFSVGPVQPDLRATRIDERLSTKQAPENPASSLSLRKGRHEITFVARARTIGGFSPGLTGQFSFTSRSAAGQFHLCVLQAGFLDQRVECSCILG